MKQEPRKQNGPAIFDEPEIINVDVPIPEFPRLPGILGKFIDAITPDISYDHKALATLVIVGLEMSGRVVLKSDPWLQTRFYGLNIGPMGDGKTAAGKEVIASLAPVMTSHVALSVDGGPALVQALSENPRFLLSPDEMADQFNKAKVPGNSLFGEWLKLYEDNKTANRTKKTKQNGGGLIEVTNAHFAMLGGVTDSRYEEMWHGSGGEKSGLRSRFIQAFSTSTMPRLKTPNHDCLPEVASALGELIREAITLDDGGDCYYLALSEAAQDAIVNWRPFEELPARLLDMCKRFAMVVAACIGKRVIDGDLMRLALAFGDYQIAIQQRLCKPDAASHVQAFENRLIALFATHKKLSWPKILDAIRPDKFPGGYEAFGRAIRSLQVNKRLVETNEVNRKGSKIWAWIE